MKIELLIIIITILSNTLFGQNKISNDNDFVAVQDTTIDSYVYISIKPITNREYLTYLVWLNYACKNLTQPFINAFPTLDYNNLTFEEKSKLIDYKTRVIELINLMDKNIADYMFNTKYIDYPILSLSDMQYDNFCKWLTDRYNENMAIIKGDLSFDPNQFGDECFSTESYLCGLYTGLVKRKYQTKPHPEEYKIKWSDQLFVPRFRMPTTYELSKVHTESQLKDYKYFDFIKRWIQFNIRVDENGLTLQMGGLDPFLKNYKVDREIALPTIKQYNADSSETMDENYLTELHFHFDSKNIDINTVSKSKEDSLGHLPYTIIGEDTLLNPIFINRLNFSNKNNFPYIYRLATNVYK